MSKYKISMRTLKLFILGQIVILYSCTYNSTVPTPVTDCSVGSIVELKETAKVKIIGKWDWVKTTYSGRGMVTTTQTPTTTNYNMSYEFKKNNVRIFINGRPTDELTYDIMYFGEGTNTVDDVLAIKFFNPKTNSYSQSTLLFLSTSFNCLTLINSHSDAGGDLTFSRTE